MPAAPIPPDEAERLRALHATRLLDTLPEPDYDGVARLAAHLCGTPVGIVSLIDAERQWLKARHGLDVTETPRTEAFCSHTILRPDELLVVSDAARDERFADNPHVLADGGLRFYAGMPILARDPEGEDPDARYAIGTVCVVDAAPRGLTEEQADALRTLARQVGYLIELRQERRRLDETRRRFEEAEAVGRIGSWEFDVATGRIQWSPEMFRLAGFDPTAGEPDYAELTARYHPDDVSHHDELVRRASQDGTPYHLDLRVLLPGGRVRWLHARGRADVDADTGRVVRLLGTAADITERKNAEIAQGTLTDELRRSNAALEEFAYIASHDLKEPLRKIQTFGDLLRRRAAGSLTPEATGYVDRIVGAAGRMQTLIDGLLAYARVGRRAARHEPTDPARVVAEALVDLEARIAEADGRIDVGPLPMVSGDPLLLRQLFQNVIGNALKFRKPDQPASVVLRGHAAGATAVITISDDGIGFDPRFNERVFEPFERLQRGHPQEGSGIGLAICRKIAEAHGGTLRAEGVAGDGVTFILTLPVAAPPAPPTAPDGASDPSDLPNLPPSASRFTDRSGTFPPAREFATPA